MIPNDFVIKVCGNIPQLGSWNIVNAPSMNDKDYPEWKLEVKVPKHLIPFQFKFAMYNPTNQSNYWEEGENRHFWMSNRNIVLYDGGKFRVSFF